MTLKDKTNPSNSQVYFFNIIVTATSDLSAADNAEAEEVGLNYATLTMALNSGAIIKDANRLSKDSPPFVSEISTLGLVTLSFSHPVTVSSDIDIYATNFVMVEVLDNKDKPMNMTWTLVSAN